MAQVVILGDSISAEAVPATWCRRIRQKRAVSIVNRAVSGRTIDAATGSGSNIVAALASDLAGLTPTAFVIFGGTNDIYYDVSGADTTARLWSLVATLQATYAGARALVVEPLLRDNWLSNGAAHTAELATYAANIVSGYAAHGCLLWRARQHPAFQNVAGAAFSGDRCHPSALGHALLSADFWLGGSARALGLRGR